MRISDWSSDVCSSDLGGAVGRDHQHGGADHLVVEVDRHHRIGAYGRGLCGHVLEGMLLGITQGLLVAAGASADDIAYPREDVADQVAPTLASPEPLPRYSTTLPPSTIGTGTGKERVGQDGGIT